MFDVLEARLNRAALAKLVNALAVIDGAEHPVIFDADFKVGMVGTVGMGASAPQMYISSAVVPAQFIEMEITVNAAAWRVSDRQPDGSPAGLTLVFLEKA